VSSKEICAQIWAVIHYSISSSKEICAQIWAVIHYSISS